MAADAKPAAGGAKKGGMLGLVIGGVLMLGLGGGAFYAVYSGAIPTPDRQAAADSHAEEAAHGGSDAAPLPAFLPMAPILVTLGKGDELRQLQLTAQLEVAPDRLADVTALTPRVLDVLNTYLRAVDPAVIEDPSAMLRMRAQMLRRVQVVTGEGLVRDLLVSEFILR
jgi:flagellar FliL protein